MTKKTKLLLGSSLLSITLLTLFVGISAAQVDPGVMPVRILEILDPVRTRIGIVVAVGRSGRGFDAGQEYWFFHEKALLEIEAQESLEIATLASGEWHDPWVVEALAWHPEGSLATWTHPTEADWIDQREQLPPMVPGGIHFVNENLGGLTIQYSERGPASLTWFKTTPGAYMQLEDGGLFRQDAKPPSTGSWWYGAIDRR